MVIPGGGHLGAGLPEQAIEHGGRAFLRSTRMRASSALENRGSNVRPFSRVPLPQRALWVSRRPAAHRKLLDPAIQAQREDLPDLNPTAGRKVAFAAALTEFAYRLATARYWRA